MTTIANLLISPVVSLKKRFGRRSFAASTLDTPPPPVDTPHEAMELW